MSELGKGDLGLSEINLMQGDCIELMKSLPAGSVDFILTDPP
jgi:DNA modification methylase